MAHPRRRSLTTRVETSVWAAMLAVRLLGMISMVLLARICIPCSVGLLASALPRLWSAVRSWLVPPYLFVPVHLIILTIWKLSEQKLQRDHRPEGENSPDAPLLSVEPIEVGLSPPIPPNPSPEIRHCISPYPAASGEDTFEPDTTTPAPALKSCGSMPKLPSGESCLARESGEKPASASTAEIKEEGDGPIEARWEAVKEGCRAASGVRRVRRSGALGRSSRAKGEPEAAAAVAAGGWRSEAERDGAGMGSGHEEWDRRFEAFIKKNYEQIRLQSRESHRRYMRRTNRA